jgi:hypothetical protein
MLINSHYVFQVQHEQSNIYFMLYKVFASNISIPSIYKYCFNRYDWQLMGE